MIFNVFQPGSIFSSLNKVLGKIMYLYSQRYELLKGDVRDQVNKSLYNNKTPFWGIFYYST